MLYKKCVENVLAVLSTRVYLYRISRKGRYSWWTGRRIKVARYTAKSSKSKSSGKTSLKQAPRSAVMLGQRLSKMTDRACPPPLPLYHLSPHFMFPSQPTNEACPSSEQHPGSDSNAASDCSHSASQALKTECKDVAKIQEKPSVKFAHKISVSPRVLRCSVSSVSFRQLPRAIFSPTCLTLECSKL